MATQRDGARSTGRPSQQPTTESGRKRTLTNTTLGEARSGPDLRVRAHLAAQLGNYYAAGVPLQSSLLTLADEYEETSFVVSSMLDRILARVERGATAALAFGAERKLLGDSFVAFVEVGEKTGRLDETFASLAGILGDAYDAKKAMWKEFTPFFVILGVAVLALISLLWYAMPVFKELYSVMAPGASLPWQTMVLVRGSDFIRSWLGIATLVGCVSAILATVAALRASPRLRFERDRLLLKVPKLGKLLMLRAVARSASTFSRVMDSVGSLPVALDMAAKVCPNAYVARAFELARPRVERGRETWQALAEPQILPKTFINVIKGAEASGKLDSLGPYVRIWDDEARYLHAALVATIEPTTKILGGIIAGFLMVAMYMPIWDLARAGGDAKAIQTQAVVSQGK